MKCNGNCSSSYWNNVIINRAAYRADPVHKIDRLVSKMNSINDWPSNPEGVEWSIKHFCPSSQSLFHYWFCSVMQATYAFWTPKFRIRIKTTRPTKQEFWGFCTQVHLIVSLAKGQINGDASRTQSFIEFFKYQLDRNRVLSKCYLELTVVLNAAQSFYFCFYLYH